MALAIATRCFSPPDSFRPRSPTCDKRGERQMKLEILGMHCGTRRFNGRYVAVHYTNRSTDVRPASHSTVSFRKTSTLETLGTRIASSTTSLFPLVFLNLPACCIHLASSKYCREYRPSLQHSLHRPDFYLNYRSWCCTRSCCGTELNPEKKSKFLCHMAKTINVRFTHTWGTMAIDFRKLSMSTSFMFWPPIKIDPDCGSKNLYSSRVIDDLLNGKNRIGNFVIRWYASTHTLIPIRQRMQSFYQPVLWNLGP